MLRPSILWCLLLVTAWCCSCVEATRKFDARILNNPDAESAKIELGPPLTQVTFDKSDKPKERNYDPYPPGGYPQGGYPGAGAPWGSITLELSPNTDLIIKPGESARLTYEVTNLRDTPMPVGFAATDTLGLIRTVQPPRLVVPPRGSSRTTVELFPPRSDNTEGLINTVTLLAQAADGTNVPRSALVRVSSEKEENDKWAPKCWFYVPGGQCNRYGNYGDACGTSGWNAEVTVQDDPSGVLRVESSPPGNLLPTRYVAGTRSPVSLMMAASCCQETMQIRVWDAAGNSRTCEAYVYGLTAAEIAVICVSIALFITLVILIVLACLLCRGRRTVVRHDLPRRPSSH